MGTKKIGTSQRAVLLAALTATLLLAGCTARWPQSDRSSAPCGPGTIKVCGNTCATIVADVGDRCSPNVCNSRFNPPLVCGAGMSCVPIGSEGEEVDIGTCQRRQAFPCDPTIPHGQTGNQCPENLVCVPLGSSADVREGLACGPQIRVSSQTTIRGICVQPRLDGEACDSTQAQARRGTPQGEDAQCAPCADPLLCWNGTCRRSCDTNPSSPGTSGTVSNCRPDTAAGTGMQFACTRNVWDELGLDGVSRQTALLCTSCVNRIGASCNISPRERARFPELNSADLRTAMTPTASTIVGRFNADVTGYCPGMPAISGFSVCGAGAITTIDQFTEMDPCCGSMACVNNRCCAPSGSTCLAHSDCCGAYTVRPDGTRDGFATGYCCDAALATLRPDLCPTVGTCAIGTPITTCNSDSDCGMNFNCTNSVCVPCGASPLACCTRGNACSSGEVCSGSPSNICTPCGIAGSVCCPGRSCAPGLTCQGSLRGTCSAPVVCGGSGQQCCAGQQCGSGLSCDARNNTCGTPCDRCRRCPLSDRGFATPCEGPGNGFCRALAPPACGGPGLPCCSASGSNDGCSRTAASPSYCGASSAGSCGAPTSAWRCFGCGSLDQICCPSTTGAPTCSSGLRCDASRPGGGRCVIGGTTCGTVGTPCCGDNTCLGDPTRIACVAGFCQSCGGVGQPCCGNVGNPGSCRTSPTAPVTCATTAPSASQCQACGGSNQPCCVTSNGDALLESCNGGMTCVDSPSVVGRRICVNP
jgi:hypothetical protein